MLNADLSEINRPLDPLGSQATKDAMDKKQIFAKNLKKALQQKNVTYKEAAAKANLKEKTLYRWVWEGISRTDNRTEPDLQSLCKFLGIERGDLWKDQSPSEMFVGKFRDMVLIWEHASADLSWFDDWHLAVRVAERFRRQARDLCKRVKSARKIASEGQLQFVLEGQVRAWLRRTRLTENDAYKKLKEWSVGLED